MNRQVKENNIAIRVLAKEWNSVERISEKN
jgi:hypothetical protein